MGGRRLSGLALRLGPVAGVALRRSGLRWLVPDGHACRAGELVAYCNIAVADAPALFAEDAHDLQLAFAAPSAGRLRRAAGLALGGYLDRLPCVIWDDDTLLGHLEGASGEAIPRLLFLAGRRLSDSAEDRSGLMTGLHDRVRAWWGEGPRATILGAGTCEQDALLRGDGHFAELFDARAEPSHIVLWQDEPQVPSARTLIERIDRGEAESDAIAADIGRAFAGEAAGSQDVMFLGALLNALVRDPLAESYAILGRAGPERLPPTPRALCLSLNAEFPRLLRHRRLGYAFNCHQYRLAALSPALRGWLRSGFAICERAPQEIADDYRALRARLPADTRLIVLNAMSTQSYERISNYRLLDEASFAASATLRAKTLNLMLHDLVAEGCLDLLDQDAAAAGLGLRAHLPDGTHASGALNWLLRDELVRLTDGALSR